MRLEECTDDQFSFLNSTRTREKKGCGGVEGTELNERHRIHVASLRREISMNCLMSFISEGMVGGSDERGGRGEGYRWTVMPSSSTRISQGYLYEYLCEVQPLCCAIQLGFRAAETLSAPLFSGEWGIWSSLDGEAGKRHSWHHSL